jgi:hypothetical protein
MYRWVPKVLGVNKLCVINSTTMKIDATTKAPDLAQCSDARNVFSFDSFISALIFASYLKLQMPGHGAHTLQ